MTGVDLAILEPAAITPDHLRYPHIKFVGYLSIGEIATTHPRWIDLRGADYLVEQNPVWKGWRIDIRSRAWQNIVIDELIPEILRQGYDGLFLDTVDTAAYLEEKDPKKFRGSSKAMVTFVKQIRRRFPKIIILPNNGLQLLNRYGSFIDGVVLEDLQTDTKFKEELLDRFQKKFKKPIFNIIYAANASTDFAKQAIAESESHGYLWYVTTVDLMHLGTVMP